MRSAIKILGQQRWLNSILQKPKVPILRRKIALSGAIFSVSSVKQGAPAVTPIGESGMQKVGAKKAKGRCCTRSNPTTLRALTNKIAAVLYAY